MADFPSREPTGRETLASRAHRHARVAYEIGRARWAVVRAAPAAAAALAFASILPDGSVAPLLISGVVGILLIAAGCVGRAAFSGALLGTVVGAFPVALVSLSGTCSLCVGCGLTLALPCAVAGAVAGVLVAMRAMRGGAARHELLIGAAAAAAVFAAVGCGPGGAAALAGLAVGAVVGGAPVLALRPVVGGT